MEQIAFRRISKNTVILLLIICILLSTGLAGCSIDSNNAKESIGGMSTVNPTVSTAETTTSNAVESTLPEIESTEPNSTEPEPTEPEPTEPEPTEPEPTEPEQVYMVDDLIITEGLERTYDQWGYERTDNGMIDTKGNEIDLSKYDYVGYAHEGIIMVSKDGKYGFIDMDGNEVVPLIYDGAEPFSEGMAAVYLTYTDGSIYIPGFGDMPIEKSKVGFVNTDGTEVIPCIYDGVSGVTQILEAVWSIETEVIGFSEGLATVKRDEKWGAIDVNGTVVVPFIYDHLDGFSEGLACVYDSSTEKYGYINTNGDIVISYTYEYADQFCNGMAVVRKGEKNGAINRSGELIVPYMYDKMSRFSEGLAYVANFVDESHAYQKGGFVNKDGKLVVPMIYDFAYSFSEGLACVAIHDDRFPDSPFAFLYGYINKQGEVVIEPQYDQAYSFSEGLAAVGKNVDSAVETGPDYNDSMWYGYINKKGNIVIEFGSNYVLGNYSQNFSGGTAVVLPSDYRECIIIKNPLID